MANRLAVAVAVILGLVAALAVRSYLRSQEEIQQKRYRDVKIIVAKRTMKKGEPLRLTMGENGMIVVRQFPDRMIKTGMITPAEVGRYKGYIAVDRIEAGAPLFRQDLQPPIEATTVATSVVPEGMRAITLSVDIVSGVAGLIRVGDRVDVLGSFRIQRSRATKTLYLIQNVRVIALDNKTDSSTVEKKRAGRQYRSITLEVTPEDAVRLVNAQEQGNLHLMLRNRGDVNTEPDKTDDGKPVLVDVVSDELNPAATGVAPSSGGRRGTSAGGIR